MGIMGIVPSMPLDTGAAKDSQRLAERDELAEAVPDFEATSIEPTSPGAIEIEPTSPGAVDDTGNGVLPPMPSGAAKDSQRFAERDELAEMAPDFEATGIESTSPGVTGDADDGVVPPMPSGGRSSKLLAWE